MWVENVINMQDNDNLANSYANVQWIKITSIYIAVYKVKGIFIWKLISLIQDMRMMFEEKKKIESVLIHLAFDPVYRIFNKAKKKFL